MIDTKWNYGCWITIFADDIKLLVRPLSREITDLNKLFYCEHTKIWYEKNVKYNILDPKTLKLNMNLAKGKSKSK